MANNPEESSPLLAGTDDANKKDSEPIAKSQSPSLPAKQPPVPTVAQPQVAETYGWAADGLPLSVMGQPIMGRTPWNSGLCSCFGRSDEFCSSDLEVCMFSLRSSYSSCYYQMLIIFN